MQQDAEIEHDDDGDEALEQQQELALGDEVRLASLVDQLGNFEHRAVHWQVLEAHENSEPEDQSQYAEQEAEHQELMAVDAEEIHFREVRKAQVGLAAGGFRGRLRLGGSRAGRDENANRKGNFCQARRTRAERREGREQHARRF